jgi:Uma2 family endonuclease
MRPVTYAWTVDDYLAYEFERGVRYEFVDGELYPRIGLNNQHVSITVNTLAALSIRTRETPCRVFNSDLRIKIDNRKYVYADVSLVCGKATFDDKKHTMLTNPLFVAEVMSPSSENYDRGQKFDFYRSLPSVQHYLLIAQKKK